MPPGAQVITENPQPGSGQQVGGAFTQQVCPVARKGRKPLPPSCHCMAVRAKPDAQKGAAEGGFVPQKPAQVQHLRSHAGRKRGTLPMDPPVHKLELAK